MYVSDMVTTVNDPLQSCGTLPSVRTLPQNKMLAWRQSSDSLLWHSILSGGVFHLSLGLWGVVWDVSTAWLEQLWSVQLISQCNHWRYETTTDISATLKLLKTTVAPSFWNSRGLQEPVLFPELDVRPNWAVWRKGCETWSGPSSCVSEPAGPHQSKICYWKFCVD